ncbi:hypothetical protein [Egicoccus halophilus]|nr:hypothetical protein [Egicoccus halophilus]
MGASADNDYNLKGMHGAEVFRDLPEGLTLRMTDGSEGKILANPGDGAFVMIEVTSDPNDPARVGEEETVFYSDVDSVVSIPGEDAK